MRALPLIAVVTMAGAAYLVGCGADREEDERQNLAILHELPTFPGARELEVATAPYYGDEGPFERAEGHTTTITYSAAHGTTQRGLVRFYLSRLERGLKCDVERSRTIDITDPHRPRRGRIHLVLVCSGEKGSISVNPDNLMTSRSRFEVVADHRGDPG